MNTKTMRLPPRRFLTPSKRKEPDGFPNAVKRPSITTTTHPSKLHKPTTAGEPVAAQSAVPSAAAKSNQVLAGYLAHEFLSKGTLFGQPFDPALPAPMEMATAKKKKVVGSVENGEPEMEPSREGAVEPMRMDKCERYVEISGLLKRQGAHIEGIVNPTQLSRFLQL